MFSQDMMMPLSSPLTLVVITYTKSGKILLSSVERLVERRKMESEYPH